MKRKMKRISYREKLKKYLDKEIKNVQANLDVVKNTYSRRTYQTGFLQGRLFELKRIKKMLEEM